MRWWRTGCGAPGGWLFKLGVLDYAGGLVVEIVSGCSALALALVLGPRIGFKKDAMRPHNLPFVLLGVGLLWFGWFGFNAGSALAANGMAAAVFLNTLVAGCLGMLGWLAVEQIRDGRPTTFGAASGVVAGLVAITPSCGTVNILGAAVVGLAAGIVCSFAVGREIPVRLRRFAGRGRRALRRRRRRCAADRTACHRGDDWRRARASSTAADSLSSASRRWRRWWSALYAFAVSYVLAKLIDRFIGFRVSAEDETTGVDFTQHAETAYAEGVHGHRRRAVRRSFGDLGAPGLRPETAEEG